MDERAVKNNDDRVDENEELAERAVTQELELTDSEVIEESEGAEESDVLLSLDDLRSIEQERIAECEAERLRVEQQQREAREAAAQLEREREAKQLEQQQRAERRLRQQQREDAYRLRKAAATARAEAEAKQRYSHAVTPVHPVSSPRRSRLFAISAALSVLVFAVAGIVYFTHASKQKVIAQQKVLQATIEAQEKKSQKLQKQLAAANAAMKERAEERVPSDTKTHNTESKSPDVPAAMILSGKKKRHFLVPSMKKNSAQAAEEPENATEVLELQDYDPTIKLENDCWKQPLGCLER